MTPSARLAPVWIILGVELAISLLVLGTGFVAVSDDDFSRVVIAQDFVANPSLDPSGTSWLPLPFLVLGSVMSVLGRSLAVARLVAVAEGAAALLLVYRAARNLGLSERAAVASSLVAAVIPTAARLGVSFQPEAMSAGLTLFAASTLSKDGAERWRGGLAIGAATLCRYEAWPAAVVFAAFCAVDAARATTAPKPKTAWTSTTPLWSAAALAVVPAILWMLHGVVRHDSALFFLHRVAGYRRAIGAPESAVASLAAYPTAFVQSEPELAIAAVTLLVLGARARDGRFARFQRTAVVLGAVVAFLVVGRLAGGTPTHHEQRPLLPIFWALAIVVAGVLTDRARQFPARASAASRARLRRTLAVGSAIVACGAAVRLMRDQEPLADRRDELGIGTEGRKLVPDGERLLVETGDYGYFAVIAAFGAPERAEPFDHRDPRDPPSPDAFTSSELLRSKLAARGATWFVTPRARETVAADVGAVVARNDTFALVQAGPLR